MPKYTTFQYSIKQYGRFDVEKSGRLTNLDFLKARIGVPINGKMVWIYSTGPLKIKRKVNRLRIKTNTGEVLYQETFNLKGNKDKIRIKSNREDYIYSTRGWG